MKYLILIFLFSFKIIAGPVPFTLEVTEEDTSPSIYPYKIKVTNGTLTDNGDGTASIANIGSEVDTLDTVSDRGNTTDQTLTMSMINTGIAATEVYQMNQAVRTTDSVTFDDITMGDVLTFTSTESGVQLIFDGQSNNGSLTWMEDENYFMINNNTMMSGAMKLYLRDTSTYISSNDANYLDLDAPTGIRLGCLTTIDGNLRSANSDIVRYYHLPLTAVNPGASGATWTSASANNLSGWQLNAAGETLEFQADVHDDWTGGDDIIVEINFALLDAGSASDTVDLKLVCYYKGVGDTVTKTQTVEVATVTDGTQNKMYKVTFPVEYDYAGNNIDKGDQMCFILNLETDTSEIDNVLITSGSFYYQTTHIAIEDGDV